MYLFIYQSKDVWFLQSSLLATGSGDGHEIKIKDKCQPSIMLQVGFEHAN